MCVLRRPLPGRRTNSRSWTVSDTSLRALSAMSADVSTTNRYRSWNACALC